MHGRTTRLLNKFIHLFISKTRIWLQCDCKQLPQYSTPNVHTPFPRWLYHKEWILVASNSNTGNKIVPCTLHKINETDHLWTMMHEHYEACAYMLLYGHSTNNSTLKSSSSTNAHLPSSYFHNEACNHKAGVRMQHSGDIIFNYPIWNTILNASSPNSCSSCSCPGDNSFLGHLASASWDTHTLVRQTNCLRLKHRNCLAIGVVPQPP